MSTPTETLIKALRILANDIQSEDGVANAAILESALRIEEDHEVIFQAGESIKILRQTVQHRNETIDGLKQRIKRMELFINRFFDPEDLGYVANQCIRDDAREALGLNRVESTVKEAKP